MRGELEEEVARHVHALKNCEVEREDLFAKLKETRKTSALEMAVLRRRIETLEEDARVAETLERGKAADDAAALNSQLEEALIRATQAEAALAASEVIFLIKIKMEVDAH